jgi:Protein of unknown function DUF262
MRLLPSDPDVETIVGRIKAGDINLQPGFQRGEVWSKLKKQRLIDSILRDWHVPPIHVIENPHTRKQEVLDGQQRLVAIRDFVEALFPVAGSVEPNDSDIEAISGLYYNELPEEWRRRFNQFTIRVFRIVDFRPSEPGELFFRLNQPTSLTGAEQRNAFFGPVREQIKGLVEEFSLRGIEREVFGFSNWRMAYDDVLSRVALAIERNTLSIKITSADLADLYRQENGLSKSSIDLVRESVLLFGDARLKIGPQQKMNKATLFSWLVFLVRSILHEYHLPPNRLFDYMMFFESSRGAIYAPRSEGRDFSTSSLSDSYAFLVYESRSVARVADVSSVVLRDAVIWLIHSQYVRNSDMPTIPRSIDVEFVRHAFTSQDVVNSEDDAIARSLIANGWGDLK